MLLKGGQAVVAAPPMTQKPLPANDRDRLFFYSEVLIANIPSLIADLSSPKYTFLSFSEKTRNEVKQKSALIQSISRTFNSVLSLSKQLEEKEAELEQCEQELVTASPPKFMTSDELLEAKQQQQQQRKGGVTGGDGADGVTEDGGFVGGSVMVLREEDIGPVRAAEEQNEAETEALMRLSREADRMEDGFTDARAKCETMTQHVQSLKAQLDSLYSTLQRTQFDRKSLAMVREELEERRRIEREAVSVLEAMEAQCRLEELEIIQQSIDKAEEQVVRMRAELAQRKERQEVELAAYKIAYKEAQAEVETTKDEVSFLRRHQGALEVLAKQQQLEEARQNSLKGMVMRTLTWSAAKPSGRKPLSSEQLSEVKADHPLVSVLAANVSVMDAQRVSVAGILAQVENAFDNDAVRVALERIHEVLGPAISLDEEALGFQG